MDIANFFVRILLTFYTVHIIKMLLFKKNRLNITKVNKRLEELRAKPLKTVEEQKEFIELRYPKFWGKDKFKFNIKGVVKFILSLSIVILILQGYKFLFLLLGIDLPLWLGIAIILFLPALINYILKKFGIHKQDISVFFR